MKLLTRDTDYAARALAQINRNNGRVVCVSQLSAKLGIARPFLRSILQKLEKAGILTSTKGRQGGFTLRREAGKISLVDLIVVFQGEERWLHCRTGARVCRNKAVCGLRKRLKALEDEFFARLAAITVADLG